MKSELSKFETCCKKISSKNYKAITPLNFDPLLRRYVILQDSYTE